MVLDKYPTVLAIFTTKLGKFAFIAALIPHFNFPFSFLLCASFVANTTRKFVPMQKVTHKSGNFVDCPMLFARVLGPNVMGSRRWCLSYLVRQL